MVVDILLDERYVPDPNGILHRGTHRDFPSGLRYIRLSSSLGKPGPIFDQVAHSSYSDESSSLLTDKLRSKSYRSPHRIELLAYYEDGFAPNDIQIQELGELISGIIGQSHFERVWLFDRPGGRVLGQWSRPPE